MDPKRALALARAVELVASSIRTAIDVYIDETKDLDALDRSVERHPAGKARPLRSIYHETDEDS